MRIFFLGDLHHANARNWIAALEKYGGCSVTAWSLFHGRGVRGTALRIAHWASAVFLLRRKIQRSGAEIVVGYRVTSYGFLAAVSGKHPLVLAAQGESDVWPEGHFTTSSKAALARFALKRADLIHAWGEHMAASMMKHGADPSKILVLPRGIDLDLFPFPATVKDWSTMRLVVSRGLHPEYRHDLIIRSVKALNEHGIPVRLTVIGEGPLREDLEQLCAELGVDQLVRFAGRVGNSQLATHLVDSNVYVSMPETEGVSASLFEAMACGCYPVVSDLPANRQWIRNGSNGELVTVGHQQELDERLRSVWERKESFEAALRENRTTVEERASQKTNTQLFVERYRTLAKP